MLTRRNALQALALGAAAPVAGHSPAQAEESQIAAATQPQGACLLFPQAVEGPYYFDPKLVRADIAEGRPGQALRLELTLIEAGPCKPLAGVRIDVWHADAGGIYSGYAGQGDARGVSTKGERYLRGTQLTDAAGRATFTTIYPGWYPGRTPHIHLKALLDERTMLTGQAYFPDEVSARVYRDVAPYSARPVADTTNARDGIYRSGERDGGGTVLAIADAAGVMTASLLIAVDRSGDAASRAGGWWAALQRMLGL